MIAKRKIRLVYEIIDEEIVKDMATKQEATEKKLASLEQELEAVKQRFTDLETQTKQAPSKTEKPKQRKLID
ncbi:MAG: hypothetical protein IJ934_06710 [Acetobacter sp.]|nr:hypothetical protein [Acetobacter sp.]